MYFTNRQPTPMRVLFDVHHCRLTPGEKDKMRDSIEALARQVENFPLSDVHVLVERNQRSNDYSVKVTLILDGATLVGNDHDIAIQTAFERCLDSLAENVQAYKDRLGQVPQRQKQQKRTQQELEPSIDPDAPALDAAVAAGDYPAFRMAVIGYEEALRKRVGRWVERYPEVNAKIGRTLGVADIVDEVFLTAFDCYAGRPKEIRFGDWLEALIDPAVRALQAKPAQELENIDLTRSAVEAEKGPGVV
jgi:ribosome-associated translation inhibitor RaiA